MCDPVEHGSGHLLVAEDLGPFSEGQIGGDDHRCLLIELGDQVKEQLKRSARGRPTMRLNSAVTDLFDFRYDDFTLEGYDPHPAIKAPVAV